MDVEPAHHERSRARARRRPRRDPHQPRRRRRAVHRRDPPPAAPGRGGALPGDGGLPARHRDRQGPVGALDPPRPARASRSSAPRPAPGSSPARCATASASSPASTTTTPPTSSRSSSAPRASSACRSSTDGAHEIARRARGTPRIANRLLKRVRDYAEVRGRRHGHHRDRPRRARAVRGRRARSRQGRPRHPHRAVRDVRAASRSGSHTLAVAVAEEPETVEEVYEPFLLKAGPAPAHAPRPGRHARRLRAPRRSPPPHRRRRTCSTDADRRDRESTAGARQPRDPALTVARLRTAASAARQAPAVRTPWSSSSTSSSSRWRSSS